MRGALQDFYSGRRVFLTGHTGFKGSWLSLYLNSLGCKVVGYALPPPTDPSLFQVADISRKVTSFTGDILDFTNLLAAFSRHHPEIVFHMAAQSLVRCSYSIPLETLATNVMGTAHVLEAARKTDSVRVVIIVTSDKCYENENWVWGYRENDPLGGHDPYSASKACAELITRAYTRSFFQDSTKAVSSVRAGNVLGGGDWAQDRLVPDCVRFLTSRKPIVLRNPQAVRPWQHVLDALTGYLLLAHKMYESPHQYSGAWNFGPGDDAILTVREVAVSITEHWGEGSVEILPDPALHEMGTLKLDSSKARTLLGWRPRWSIQKTIAKTVEWYKAHAAGEAMEMVCRNQIREYLEV
ncbi:MAG: CDP-glucose 4,6-dehydratase [Desulfosoma sp.]